MYNTQGTRKKAEKVLCYFCSKIPDLSNYSKNPRNTISFYVCNIVSYFRENTVLTCNIFDFTKNFHREDFFTREGFGLLETIEICAVPQSRKLVIFTILV